MQLTYLVCVLLPFVAMVQSDVIESSQLDNLQKTIQTTIKNKIREELDASVPVMDSLKADFETCASSVESRQFTCQTCAGGQCDAASANFFVGIGKGTLNFFNDIGNQFVSLSGLDDMGEFLKRSWITDIRNRIFGWSGWKTAGDWFSGALGSFGDSLNSAGNTIAGWFGNRRSVSAQQVDASRVTVLRRRYAWKRTRALGPRVRNCISKCDSCSPFITVDTKFIIGEVCGDEFLVRNRTMANKMHHLGALYNRNKAGPMVTRIEYSKSNMNMAISSISPITVTALLPDNIMAAYRSNVPFYPMNVTRTAAELAEEIYHKWGL